MNQLRRRLATEIEELECLNRLIGAARERNDAENAEFWRKKREVKRDLIAKLLNEVLPERLTLDEMFEGR